VLGVWGVCVSVCVKSVKLFGCVWGVWVVLVCMGCVGNMARVIFVGVCV
jgi:hypothetical protein